jgi:hypothetical protein
MLNCESRETPKMKLPKVQQALPVITGLLTFWLLRRFMDRDGASVHAAIQRQWLVVGLLLAGAYVVLRFRGTDAGPNGKEGVRAISPTRYRQLGLVGWVFLFAGVVMAGRLLWLNR